MKEIKIIERAQNKVKETSMKNHLLALTFCIIALPTFGDAVWEKRVPLLVENSEMSVAQLGY